MLIPFLFKENGPENSVILYDDPIAIGEQGQTVPFACIEKTNGKQTRGYRRLQLQHFYRLLYQHASEDKSGLRQPPLSWRLVCALWRGHSLEGPLRLCSTFLSLLRNYMCVSEGVHKVNESF